MHKRLRKKVLTYTRRLERKLLGITWIDIKKAPWIKEETKLEDILVMIKNGLELLTSCA